MRVENDSESHLEFASAVIQRIAHLERAGRTIKHALIAVGPESGGPVFAARCLLTRAVVLHQIQGGAGDVELDAEPRSSAELQHELMSLVGTLTAELGRSDVSIKLKLDTPWETSPRPAVTAESETRSGVRTTAASNVKEAAATGSSARRRRSPA